MAAGSLRSLLTLLLCPLAIRANTKNVVETALEHGCNMLVQFIDEAGLRRDLEGPGPFTLFAPTDNAFADLSDPMRQLLQSSTSTLKDVLKYHVVEANVTSAILNNEQLLDTVEMARIRINVYTTEEIRPNRPPGVPESEATLEATLSDEDDVLVAGLAGVATNDDLDHETPTDDQESAPESMGDVADTRRRRRDSGVMSPVAKMLAAMQHKRIITASGQRVIQADIMASNGVIHLVDGVLRVPVGTIIDYISQDSDLATMVSVIKDTGHMQLLDEPGNGPFTLLVPNNNAFHKVDPDKLASIQANPDHLKALLWYHIIPGTYYRAGLSSEQEIETYNSSRTIVIKNSPNEITVNSVADVITNDISVVNGVIHVIDAVLMPGEFGPDESTESAASRSTSTLLTLLLLTTISLVRGAKFD